MFQGLDLSEPKPATDPGAEGETAGDITAALEVAGRTEDLAAGLPIAAEAIDSGAAAAALDRWVAVSNG